MMTVRVTAHVLGREVQKEDASSAHAADRANVGRGLLLPLPTHVLGRIFALRVRAAVALTAALVVLLAVALTGALVVVEQWQQPCPLVQ